MASAAFALEKSLEDPLEHLPCSRIIEYPKGQIIYSQDHPSTSLYLVINGSVKTLCATGDNRQVLVDIYRRDDFFGEAAFLHRPDDSGQAIAIENTKVMAWPASDIEDIAMKRPRLAIALLQILVQRKIDFIERIASFSVDTAARRLARSLIRFAERLGTAENDGTIRMMPLTHELLAQYVGTSREIVTQFMAEFRRQGYIRYSRSGIVVYRDALREWLNQNVRERLPYPLPLEQKESSGVSLASSFVSVRRTPLDRRARRPSDWRHVTTKRGRN